MIYIELALIALRQVLDQLNVKGATGVDVSADIAIAQAAIDSLMKVHGTPTMYAQLEASRTQKLW